MRTYANVCDLMRIMPIMIMDMIMDMDMIYRGNGKPDFKNKNQAGFQLNSFNVNGNMRVSFFPHITSKKPSGVIKIDTWLDGGKIYRSHLEKVRNEKDPARQRELKIKLLPAITPSGKFRTRKANSLIYHSGFISLDFDNTDPEKAKEILAGLPFVYYAGLSASGKGIWALIPISEPQYHQNHFEALKIDLLALGLELDKQCSDIGRLRFYSYDPAPVYNSDCTIYTRKEFPTVTSTPTAPAPDDRENYRKIQLLVNRIEATGTDITAIHQDWIKIAGVLVNLFGEAGRPFYHAIGRYYPGYTPKETDLQFTKCLKNPRPYGLGMIMTIAKKYGVILKR